MWIPVEERLPEDGQCVLTYCPERYYPIDIHQFYAVGSRGPDAWWIGGGQNYLLVKGNITHWMPLPKGPES